MKKLFTCCISSESKGSSSQEQNTEFKTEPPNSFSQRNNIALIGVNQNSPSNNSKYKGHLLKASLFSKQIQTTTTDNKSNLNVNTHSNIKNELLVEYINSLSHNLQAETNKFPIVQIEEEENGNMFNKTPIKINACGIIGGKNSKLGISFFGKKNSHNKTSNSTIDYELNIIENLPYPYIFVVYFQRENEEYYIKPFLDNNPYNNILFIKLDNNYIFPIKQKEHICAGNIVFEVTPIEKNCIEIAKFSMRELQINKKIMVEPKKFKKFTIGRDEKCNLSFPKEKSLSRMQTTFIYNEEDNCWVVKDGYREKSSANGTWVFGTHSFVIKNQMTVQILTSKVKFTLIKGE